MQSRTSGGGNSGGGGGNPPEYKGPGVATGNAINPLPEVDLGVVESKNQTQGGITDDGIVVYGDKDAANDARAGSGVVQGLDRGSGSIEVGGADIKAFNTLLEKIINYLFSSNQGQDNSTPNQSSMEMGDSEPDGASNYDIIYTVEAKATPGSLYGSGSTEADRGGAVKSQPTKNFNKAKSDSVRLIKREPRWRERPARVPTLCASSIIS